MSKALPILLVDDNESEVILVREALEKAELTREVIALSSAEEAIEYLSGAGRYAERSRYPLPCFVLLDMRMPGLDGFEVLKWRNTQPQLKDLPLLAYTNSLALEDIHKVSELGAQDYLLKPNDTFQLAQMMKRVAERWLGQP